MNILLDFSSLFISNLHKLFFYRMYLNLNEEIITSYAITQE